MGATSPTFDARWRSKNHIGPAKPTAVVKVRKGRFLRGYKPWAGDDINASFPGLDNSRPWQPTWSRFDGSALQPSDYVDVPGVLSISYEQDFEANGITTATIQIENIAFTSQMGGLYHLIERGYLAPWRGYDPRSMPPAFAKNSWYQKLLPNAQITVWQGYGEDELVKTFTGIIHDLDMTSKPDRITVTARDFGQNLTDSRLFIWNKDPRIRDPVIFADRLYADDRRPVGGGARASSDDGQHKARFVTDSSTKTYWASTRRPSKDDVEWVQVKVPRGRYESIILHPKWENHEIFIGVYARTESGHARIGDDFQDTPGWLTHPGGGVVPGSVDGGWPYIKHIQAAKQIKKTYPLPRIETGDNSVFRIGIRKLKGVGGGDWKAGMIRVAPVKRRIGAEAKERHWVLVNDAADVVKVILRWAGFKEWDVEDTGVRVKGKVAIGRDKYMIDVIRQMCDLTGFVFFMADPDDDDNSLGIPTFRRNGTITTQSDIRQIKDTDLLTGIQVRTTDEPLSTIIRVRGKEAPKNADSPFEGGRVLGADRTRRLMSVYRPPWQVNSGEATSRLASIIKHVNVTMPQLSTLEECYEAAYLIALQEALESTTAVLETPGTPKFEMDDQVALVDTGTGINTRMWIARRSSEMQLGEQARWKSTLGGALIDTPDIDSIIRDLNAPWHGVEEARSHPNRRGGHAGEFE